MTRSSPFIAEQPAAVAVSGYGCPQHFLQAFPLSSDPSRQLPYLMEAFTSAYAPSANVYEYPNRLVATGRDEIPKRYERLFAETPALHVQILHRLASGRTIIDQERVTGLSESKIRGGFAVYEVADRVIQNVTLIPDNWCRPPSASESDLSKLQNKGGRDDR